MAWNLHILGTNAAAPVLHRHPSAQVLATDTEIFLIDCGEATQSRLSEYKIRRSRIQHIFISHLHGDHIFGLPGLITSYNLFGRNDDLHIYGPRGLRNFIETVNETTGLILHYDLIIHEHPADVSQKILENDLIRVSTLPLDHRIPTTGYIFREKILPKRINREAIEKYQVPYQVLPSLQLGKDWLGPNGVIINNELLTFPGREPLSFAYCSDTRYLPSLIPQLQHIDLLYHEATFASDLGEEAHKRGHSTAAEAGKLAYLAGVRQLVIGHFSTRYKDLSILLREAQDYFPNTILAREGLVIPLNREVDTRI